MLRGHTPGRDPAWFGPAIGRPGMGRFDWPHREQGNPGICYVAPRLTGVMLERVIRDAAIPVLSVARLDEAHAITTVRCKRDLLLVDLLVTPWTIHQVQVATITAPPPYDETQHLATRLAQIRLPALALWGLPTLRPDGIAYGSRFGAAHECFALWDHAADALEWGDTAPFSADREALAHACLALGIGLRP